MHQRQYNRFSIQSVVESSSICLRNNCCRKGNRINRLRDWQLQTSISKVITRSPIVIIGRPKRQTSARHFGCSAWSGQAFSASEYSVHVGYKQSRSHPKVIARGRSVLPRLARFIGEVIGKVIIMSATSGCAGRAEGGSEKGGQAVGKGWKIPRMLATAAARTTLFVRS